MTVWVAKGFLMSRHGGGDSPAHGGPKEAKARRRVIKPNGTIEWYGGGNEVLFQTDLTGSKDAQGQTGRAAEFQHQKLRATSYSKGITTEQIQTARENASRFKPSGGH